MATPLIPDFIQSPKSPCEHSSLGEESTCYTRASRSYIRQQQAKNAKLTVNGIIKANNKQSQALHISIHCRCQPFSRQTHDVQTRGNLVEETWVACKRAQISMRSALSLRCCNLKIRETSTDKKTLKTRGLHRRIRERPIKNQRKTKEIGCRNI